MTTTLTTTALVTFRRLAGCALIALAAQTAFAQSAPSDSSDPPGRVARLNYMAGTVTTEPAGASDWSYASINRPLTTGDQLWNDANARSELHVGSTAVRLGPSTSLDVLNLDDSTAQLKVAQGTLSTRVRVLPPNTSYEIDTPNAAISVTQPGDYRVDVAPDGSTTTVSVRSGALTAYGDSGQVPISAGQQVTFTGTSLQAASSGAVPPPDAFDQWAASRDAAEDRSVSARYVSRDIPGYQDLDANGTWSDNPQYGNVWVPNSEPAGWAPYHDGHWAWVAPWGWTWIDDAPWGFAPYHYGRWVYVGSSWAWVPGPLVAEPPVYAPALVAFVGDGGGGFNLSINLFFGGRSDPGVAWFPLGPGDVWHPGWGGWSNRYYERVNQTVIINHNVNITNIHNTYINYHAPGALTAIPANTFVHGQPVARFAQKVDPRQWHNAQINSGAPAVAPVRESLASGLRPANYRPPQALTNRPVVATRQAPMPAAFHDPLAQHLAQSGAKIPGAGQPFTGMTAPAGVGAQHGYEPAGAPRNVHVVAQNSPVVSPRPAPAAAGRVPNGPRGVAGAQNVPHAPVAGAHTSPSGVPRPPVMGNTNVAPNASSREPSWTQPHAPMSQQRVPAAQSHVAPSSASQWQQATRPAQPSPQATSRPNVQPHAIPSAQPQTAYRQPNTTAQQPRPQPRPAQYEVHPQQPVMQPRPQPQIQPRPQPQPQPQMQPRPQPPHVQPMQPQPRPQVQAMQPHPQMQAMQSHPPAKPASHTNTDHQ